MTSRERVKAALNHKQPDKVPLDLGATPITGMGINAVMKLRQAFGLPKMPVKVRESYQMLGNIDSDLIEALGIDIVSPIDYKSMFGFRNEGWKDFSFHNDNIKVPDGFNTKYNEDGTLYMYPEGDKTAKPSGIMPKDGWYFDTIVRQKPIDEDKLNVKDNLEEFTPYSEESLRYIEKEIDNIYKNTNYAIIANPGGMALGDIALVPAPQMKDPKGIRDIEEWYISTAIRTDYVKDIFAQQVEIAIENLKKYLEAVGNKIEAVIICGTDFGTQTCPFISVETFRTLYLPYYKKINDWIHQNTQWKTFKHSCGAIEPLIPSFIDAGFDILNPVQIAASGMEPKTLKEKYQGKIVFWGGGVDTQGALPFGTPDEVREQVKNMIEIFGKNGGYVFNPVHNVQGNTPIENLVAMYETVSKYR